MKANELMMRDWVYCPDLKKPIKIEHGWQIEETEELGYEAIPLTLEILEKNGFLKSKENERMYYWNWSISEDCVSYDTETSKIRIFHTLGGLAFVEPLTYVHELQHALAICGINKEIEL